MLNAKQIRHLFFSTATIVLLFLGYTAHIQGARNVVNWYLWFCVAMCGIVIISGQTKKLNDKRAIPLALDLAYDIFIAGFLLWYAQWWLGGTYISVLLIIAAIGSSTPEEKAKDEREEQEKKNKDKFKDGVKKFDF
jgi:CHASE2 domain-containing sensor protein